MYALTLWQPWAHVVASGVKRIENRPWEPPAALIGERFAIHAGKKWDEDAAFTLALDYKIHLVEDEVVFGAIIATARLIAVTTYRDRAERLAGQGQGVWFFGPFGWVLDNICKIESPVKCRGYQKLWRVSGLDV